MVEPEATNDNTIWRICIACWISKATRAYNTYCFPTARVIHERASVLHCTYITFLITVSLRQLRSLPWGFSDWEFCMHVSSAQYIPAAGPVLLILFVFIDLVIFNEDHKVSSFSLRWIYIYIFFLILSGNKVFELTYLWMLFWLITVVFRFLKGLLLEYLNFLGFLSWRPGVTSQKAWIPNKTREKLTPRFGLNICRHSIICVCVLATKHGCVLSCNDYS